MPSTKLGRWGFGLIITAAGLVALSMITALFLSNPAAGTAYNVLGILAPVFILVSLVALVLSWIAILKHKDRGLLLIIFASVLTALCLFFFIGEVAESSWSGN